MIAYRDDCTQRKQTFLSKDYKVCMSEPLFDTMEVLICFSHLLLVLRKDKETQFNSKYKEIGEYESLIFFFIILFFSQFPGMLYLN